MESRGVVFTKDWVVEFVLDLAGYTPDHNLSSGCVTEPACGNGAFLRHIVTRLCESASREGRLTCQCLAGCVRAFDVEPTAVAASRTVVRAILARWGFSPEETQDLASVWVSQADYLIADVPPSRWVIGNPPYVRASAIPREQRELYKLKLSCVTMGSDLYVGFFEKALTSLSEDGSLCFICSDRWLQNRYGSRLRAFVSQGFSLDAHVRMHGVDAFEDEVAAYPAVSLIKRGKGRPIRYAECQPSFSAGDASAMVPWVSNADGATYEFSHASVGVLSPLSGPLPVPLADPERLRLLDFIAQRHPLLEDAGVRLGIGVASGCDEVFITEDRALVEEERLLPLFFMRDWRAGRRDMTKCLVNPWNADGTLVNLDDFPRLRAYYVSHQDRLRRRRVARDYPLAWYRTLDKPNRSLMGHEMLLFPDMAARSDPVYSDGSRYPHHNCYWMTSSEWDIKALGGLMMSDLVEGYVDAFGVKMRGSTLRFQAQYLRMVHIPRSTEVDEVTKRKLAEAFATGNRELANEASRQAYGLEVASCATM